MTATTFSIIIPTYNRISHLELCLESIAALDYPKDSFEVIVVDDGSDQNPEDVIGAFKGTLDIRLIHQDHRGPASARNTGATAGKNEYVVFTDDDCAAFPDWLSRFAVNFADHPDYGIGGHTLNGLLRNPYSAASQLLIDYLYSYFNSNNRKARFFTSNNLAFPRKQFLEIGGFDATFPRAAGEDRELCYRWMKHGLELAYTPDVKLYHRHPLTFRMFLRQHFNYGRGAFAYHQIRALRNIEPIRIEPFSFYLNLIRYPFREQRSHSCGLLALLMGITQLANASGFFWEKFQFGEPQKSTDL